MARVLRADQVTSGSFEKIEAVDTDFALEQAIPSARDHLGNNRPNDETGLSQNIVKEAQLRADALIDNAEQRATKLQNQAELELEAAKTQAETMLQQAEADANQLLTQAQAEIEQQLQTAQQSGFEQGLQAGQQAVVQQTEQLTDTLQQAIVELSAFKTQLVTQYEAEILEFVMVVATKIVGFELTVNPKIIVEVVRDGLTHLKDKSEISLYLNPDDLALMREYRPQLLEQVEGIGTLNFVPDETLIIGECRLENRSNLIDSTWREKLSNAAETVWTLYHTAKVTEIGPA